MGSYKHGKQTTILTPQEYLEILEHGKFVKARLHRAFFTLLYYSGSRVSEVLRLQKENFELSVNRQLKVSIKPMKGGLPRGDFFFKIGLPGVDNLLEIVKKTRKNRKVFTFNRVTAWNIIKRACGKEKYPHFFRLNRCVNFLNDPNYTQNDIRVWFGWKSLKTIDYYVGYSPIITEKLSKGLK